MEEDAQHPFVQSQERMLSFEQWNRKANRITLVLISVAVIGAVYNACLTVALHQPFRLVIVFGLVWVTTVFLSSWRRGRKYLRLHVRLRSEMAGIAEGQSIGSATKVEHHIDQVDALIQHMKKLTENRIFGVDLG